MPSPAEKLAALPDLPVRELAAELNRALATAGMAVLQAPPGSGKTTLLPLLLLTAGEEGWLAGKKIVLLEPRRLAARNAARRMAGLLGEEVGNRVGYRMRGESRIGPRTRIEVVTEGILTRLLQADPALEEYGLVIFDEFHERHLQGDLGLVLARQCREWLRPDLRLLLMSATLAAPDWSAFLGGVPVLEATGRPFAVTLHYLDRDPPRLDLDLVRRTLLRALDETCGDLLLFLPGRGEIESLSRRLAEGFAGSGRRAPLVLPLYGELPRARQEAAFTPQPGRRRLILATDIAESSLTLPGIRVVVDCGFRRIRRFDAAAGMGRFATVRISRAAAEQRAGRAGREDRGSCYRLWSRGRQEELLPETPPEILRADLAPLALELALWGGSPDGTDLAWPTPPPAAALAAAYDLLERLGAVDKDSRITPVGRKMAQLGLHPRLARMVLEAQQRGWSELGIRLAVLLENRDPFPRTAPIDSDLETRLELLFGDDIKRRRALGLANAAPRRLDEECRRLARRLAAAAPGERQQPPPPGAAGELLAAAYPDRIARRRNAAGRRYRLSGGGEAYFPEPEPLAAGEWLVVAELDRGGGRAGGRIRRAVAYDEESLRRQFGARLRHTEEALWDPDRLEISAWRRLAFGALELRRERLARPAPQRVLELWREAFTRHGVELLPFDEECRQWCARIEFLRRVMPPDPAGCPWPAADEKSLLAEIDTWLLPHLENLTRAAELNRLPLLRLLQERLDWSARQRLEELAPSALALSGGRRVRLDYTRGEKPILAVRLQELLGWCQTPRVAGGRVAVRLEILSPARRPLQMTDDLAGFWRGSYAAVRKEMRGRYPKHAWPEEPLGENN